MTGSTKFSERLQHVASVKKKYQSDLVADLCKDSGTVSKWWNGGLVPGPKNTRLLADYFGCDFHWLETGEGDAFSDPTHNAVDRWLANEDRPPSELSELELDIAMERFVQKGRKRLGLTEGKQVNGELNKELDERSINELLRDTKAVLESDTVYRQALASNIRAFNQAVINEGKMKNTDEKIDQMMKQIEALTNIVLQGQAEPEKKRAGNDD